MMNHRFFSFVVLSLLCAGVLLKPMGDTVWAVEFPSDQSNASEQVSPEVGTEVIQTAVEAGQPPFKPMPIGRQVGEYLSQRSVQKGWNADKQIFISVGTVYFDSEDPSYDDTFVTKRSLKTMQATLEAKAKIIEYVNTNMTAMDQVRIPGTDLANKFKQEFEKQEKKLLSQKEIIAKLLAEVDKTEAAKLNGVTFSDRLNRLMDAAIAKLDKSYNAGQIDEKKLKKFEKAKQRYQEALAEHDRLRRGSGQT